MKLFGELEELKLASLPGRRLEEVLSALTYNRLFTLPEYYSKFYALAAAKDVTTRAVRYVEVAEHSHELDLSSYQQIVVAGLFKMTHSTRKRGTGNSFLQSARHARAGLCTFGASKEKTG